MRRSYFWLKTLPMIAGLVYSYNKMDYAKRQKLTSVMTHPGVWKDEGKKALITVKDRSGAIEGITPKSILAGALSFFVWPGLGQAVNGNAPEKVLTHTAIGLFPPVRLVSGLDALLGRQGGFLQGKI